ncbi:hypothetical protein KHP62_02605 [Rhodobacteraceae bacterium NNCM2]|nr:hypothetical protein [Coraliihabitans acroporae]
MGILKDVILTVMDHWVLFLMYAVLISSLAGIPNTGLGVHNMFHDDPALSTEYAEKGRWGAFLNSPAIFVQAWIVVYVTLVWGFIHTLSFIRGPDTNPEVMPGLIAEVMPYVIGTSVINLIFGVFSFTDRVGPFLRNERLRCVIGVALGLGLGWLMLHVAVLIEPYLTGSLSSWFWEWGTIRPTIALAIPAGLIMGGALIYKRLIPGVAIVTLFSLILFIYALVSIFPTAYHPIVVIVLLMLIVFFSNLFKSDAPLKFEIPGIVARNEQGELVNHYQSGLMLDIHKFYGAKDEEATPTSSQTVDKPDDRIEEAAMTEALVGETETVVQAEERASRASAGGGAVFASTDGLQRPDNIDPIIALEAWRRRVAPDGSKPKLVLMATSGGAYRASFWTAIVLDEMARLEREGVLPGFCANIRLITGASGGMVGGAYFTAMMNETGMPTGSLLDQMERDIIDVQTLGKIPTKPGEQAYQYMRKYPLPRDSLSAVAQQLVQRDIPRLFMAGVQRTDRGTVLEDQWRTLDISFGDIRNDEANGVKPSIIFSPMLVETGQPLLIGNLDMDAVRGGDKAERAVFFDWFRESRDTFKLKTAVRLNAAFPYIAPSSALPTKPYRRVVDAGYYDNYGIDMAVSYLSEPMIRDWVIRNTSGVMILQVRAFPFTEPGAEQPGPIARGLQWLTTPLEGIGSARGATMKFRNTQSLRRLESAYYLRCRDLGAPEGFLQSCVFDVQSDTSLSWYMPKRELDEMRGDKGMTNATNRASLAALKSFWGEGREASV